MAVHTLNPTLNHALKEWAAAVAALTAGETSLLLRKGGIREAAGRFTVPYNQVLLYPTAEHQRPELLKPAYRSGVQPVPAGWHPDTVTLQGVATIDRVFPVSAAAAVRSLLPHHIWTEQFVTERLRWKPSQPVYALVLRVSLLPQPVDIAWQAAYGGCRSWIDLVEPVDVSMAQPVLTDAAHADRLGAIEPLLAGR